LPEDSSFFSWITYRKSLRGDEDTKKGGIFFMWKKTVPAVALCSLLLVGCNTNDNTVPSNNETPMQDIKRDVEDVTTPDVNTPSPNNGRDVNNYNNGVNGVNDGTTNNGVNDGTINNGINGNGTNQNITPNAENKWIKEPNVKDEVINDGTMK